MTENVYNIIWADDQIDDILTDSLRARLESCGIHILKTMDRSETLLKDIESFGPKLNAVIVDANFSEFEGTPESERDTKGLQPVRIALDRYREKLPFILYSQRDTGELKKECPWIKDDFKYGVNWIGKDADRNKLISIIIAQIEKYNSPEFRVRCKYRKEFEAAELIRGAEKLLTDGLMYEYNGNWESTEDYFNPARNLVECVFNRGREKGILPNIPKPNEMARFCYGEEINGYQLHEQIMPATLKKCLKYFLDITNDGSHSRYDLSLKVREYVREYENINLYRSILYIAMDVLLWYKNLEEDREGMGVPWIINFEYKGLIGKKFYPDGKSAYHCGEYKLQYQESLVEGREVIIRTHIDSHDEDKAIGLNFFCPLATYELLDE